MRSTTFDMIGMTLMALVTILTSGGILTWNYLKQAREDRQPAPARSSTERSSA